MSALSGDVTIPKVGSVPKKVIIPLGVGAAAFVAWRYMQASRAPAAEETPTVQEWEGQETLPAVAGAYQSDQSYGIGGSTTEKSTGDYGFTGTTNDQWAQYVTEKLSGSETWSYTEIVSALGAYLNGRALTSTQQQIVQAGIALGGNPPVGSNVIIPGGDTKVTVAPTGLKATKVTTRSVSLSWSAVPGATGYRVYRDGVAQNVHSSRDTTGYVGGLEPGTSYTFYVAAEGVGNTTGPKSSGLKVTTNRATVSKPTGLKVTGTTTTSVSLSWTPVSGADFYRVYVNGVARGVSEDASHTIGDLKKGTRYKIEIKADSTGGSPSPAASVSATTKKK